MKSYKDYNIILVNIDGFRRDKVHLCPTLNSFKEKSYFFSEMNTISPYTFASLHSVFSGMTPSRHGVNGYYNIQNFKKDDVTTLSQLLQQNGFFTSCDVISDLVIPNLGFDDWNIFDEETIDFKQRHSEFIKKLAKKEKFFLFLHYTETHKYLVREIVQKYKQESNDDDYFNSIEENDQRFNSYIPSCDEYVSVLLKTIEDSGISDKTILIFFSDHGTSIGEKPGEKFYGVFVYDYTLNVFCIINIPGESSKQINKQCRTTDIFTTIAEIAGIDIKSHTQVQGESLLELLEDKSEPREIFAETGGLYGPWPSRKKHNVFCVKYNGKKLIYNDTPQTWEFYDLENDPKEQENLFDENSNEIQQFKKRLLHHLHENNIDTKIS